MKFSSSGLLKKSKTSKLVIVAQLRKVLRLRPRTSTGHVGHDCGRDSRLDETLHVTLGIGIKQAASLSVSYNVSMLVKLLLQWSRERSTAFASMNVYNSRSDENAHTMAGHSTR